MVIDNRRVEPTQEYTFELPGEHTIYVLLDLSQCNTLHSMFSAINNLKSISFTNLFDTQNIQFYVFWLFFLSFD